MEIALLVIPASRVLIMKVQLLFCGEVSIICTEDRVDLNLLSKFERSGS